MQSKSCWTNTRKLKYVVTSDTAKHKYKYIKGSVFSILAGLIAAGIFLSILNINPFQYFGYLFDLNFNKEYLSINLNWTAVYIVAGLAMAVAFKSGIFNIGAPGQILTGTSLASILLFIQDGKNVQSVSPGMIILMFLVCVISAAFLALIAGLLKALFNIHEVVTTILLNWAVFYIFKWVFINYQNTLGGGLTGTSQSVPDQQLTIFGNDVIIPLIIAFICVIAVWILLSKTTLGFSLKAVGSSPSASKYAGINVKTQIINSITLSGAIAGVAGFISLFTVAPNNYFASDSLPTLGFDSIAVSLVAFNNPIGIIFIGWLWAAIKTGGAPISSLYGISTQIAGLISGIIIYFTAIAAIFIMFKPWELLKNKYYLITSKWNFKIICKLRLHIIKLRMANWFACCSKEYKNRVNQTYEKYCKAEKISQENMISNPSRKWEGRKNVLIDFKKELALEILFCKNRIKETLKFVKEENTTLNIAGLKTKHRESQLNIVHKFVQDSSDFNLQYEIEKQRIIEIKNNQLNKYQTTIKQNKLLHKTELKSIKMFKETQIGIITYKFEYHDNLINIKTTTDKLIANIKEEIRNVKSQTNLTKEEIIKKVKELQQQKQDIIANAKEKQLEQKQKYLAQKQRVHQEKVQLEIINDQYNKQIEEEKTRFETINQQALANKQKSLELIDMNKSRVDVEQATIISNNLLVELQRTNNEFSDVSLENNKKVLNKSNQIFNKLKILLGNEIIKEYDSQEFINKKIKIYLKSYKELIKLQKHVLYIEQRLEEQKLKQYFKTIIPQALELIKENQEKHDQEISSKFEQSQSIKDLAKILELEKNLKVKTNLQIEKLEKSIVKGIG